MNDRVPDVVFAIYFSPYTAHAIEMEGTVYPTAEHAYQCARYTDEKIREEIRAARSPVKAWETSSKYKGGQIPEFKEESHKRRVMKDIMRLKAKQHEEVRKALLDSGNAQIVKHIHTYPPGDGYWDDGTRGEGRNEMGRIWMELREEFKEHG
jgi:ribA/ribD-fused uncharacterized protein